MDKKSFTLINILRNIVSIYFDTFFTIYFFKLVDYQILPLAKYYLIVFLVLPISFWLLKTAMKNNLKVANYRLGISFTAIYLALIMILKEKIVDYVYIVAIFKGLGEGFYYYPRNILNTEKITSLERRRYEGIVNGINQVSSIIMPLILGLLIDKFSYVQIGKVVFILMIVIFGLTFFVKENKVKNNKSTMLDFTKKAFKEKDVREILILQFLRGLTISSGVLTVVMTLYKINYFQSNTKIGSLNSILGLITFIACLFYASKVKKEVYKPIIITTLVSIVICIVTIGLRPTYQTMFIIYLVIYAFGISLTSLIGDTIIANKSDHLLIKFNKEEYQLLLETVLGIARVAGYLVLLLIGLLGVFTDLKYILFLSIIPITLMCNILIKNIDGIN